jgi:hypothetical protein
MARPLNSRTLLIVSRVGFVELLTESILTADGADVSAQPNNLIDFKTFGILYLFLITFVTI